MALTKYLPRSIGLGAVAVATTGRDASDSVFP
jgi:hypothetical protein